ncbi:MAG: sensor histidine kinase, partial [Nocardioides sp.]
MTAPGRASKVAAAATLVAIYLAGTGAVSFASDEGAVASWWPAAGLSVALMAMAPRAWWPLLTVGVAVASGAANLTGGRDVPVSVLFGVANAGEAVVAGLILKNRSGRTPTLTSLDDFRRLAVASLAGGLVVATGAALTVAAFGDGSLLGSWGSVFAAHAAATLVIVPVALAGVAGGAPRHRVELLAQVTALVAVTTLVFAPEQTLPLAFAPLPLLVWAALRFDVRIVSWQLLALSVLCTVLTATGLGPFSAAVASGDSSAALADTMVQIWLLSAALMSLPLTVAIEQRRGLLTQVSAREELFRRNFTESLTGMLLLHAHGDRLQIVDANEAALRLLGRSETPLVGRYLDRVLDHPQSVRRLLQSVITGELAGWHSQTGLADRPGTRVNVAVSLLAGGAEPVYSAQLLDVTVEHEARTRIEAAESLTSATLDTTACIILVTDMEGTVVRANAATTTLTGFTPEQLLGRPIWAHLVAGDRIEAVQRAFASGDGADIDATRETDTPTAGGGFLRVTWSNSLVRDEHGTAKYVVLTGIDVTAERGAAGLLHHLLQAAISTGLIGLDVRGRITLVNSGAQHLLGYDASELIGRPFVDLLDPREARERASASGHPDAFAALTAELGPEGESQPRDWTFVASSGERHTVSMTLSRSSEGAGAQAGFLCVGRDVTEQRHSQELLMAALDKERTAADRLRRLDAAKNEFVSTVSHELRTPVTSIIGYTEMLEDGSVVAPHVAQLPMLATIARNGERLITICNDLLLLGGLDSGATSWERDHVELCGLLGHVEESLRPMLNGRRLDVSFDVPDEPVVVLGDRVQLERAVMNLMSNAVKFTEDHGTVGCRLEPRNGEAWLVVHDDGIGIPEDEQGDLFTKFFRSTTAQDRAIPGTGLGLSIVAGIVA